MNKKIFLNFNTARLVFVAIFFLISTPLVWGQTPVTRIHTDWKGYWTSNASAGAGNRPDLQNNLLGFTWNGTTYSTGVNDAILTSNGVTYSPQKYKALAIQSLGHTADTYFIQGSMIDGNQASRVLTPSLTSSSSIQTALASRLTDGVNGLALGTGIANIAASSVSFKIGTDNLNVDKLNDGIPDFIVTQIAQPNGADSYKFIDVNGNLVGNVIKIDFNSIPLIGSYSLDLFNATSGVPTTVFVPGEVRDIRLLGIETKSFGINTSNAALVDRFVVTFSGGSDCAFIAINNLSLKTAELSLIKKVKSISGSGTIGDKIEYTFEVKNTGKVSVTNVTVSDPLPGIEITGTQGTALAVGATVTLNGSYTITSQDVITGIITNSAKVTGIDPLSNNIADISGHTNSDDLPTVTYLLKAPTGITGKTAIYNGEATTLTLVGGPIEPGIIPEWFEGNCGGVPINTGSSSITVFPVSNTTYFVRYKGTGSYATTCTSQLITVKPLNTITLSSAAGTDRQTKYVNTPITPITYITTGAEDATITGLTPGLSGSFRANTVTITGIPTTPDPVTYNILLTGGGGNISVNGTITVLCKPINGVIKFTQIPKTTTPVTNYPFQFSITGKTSSLDACSETLFPLKLYAATNALNTNTQLYTNTDLKTAFTGNSLWFKNGEVAYKIDANGKITEMYICYVPPVAYEFQFSNPGRDSSSLACAQTSFTNKFYATTSILGIGSQLYTSLSLSAKVGSGNLWYLLADNGTSYRIGNDGKIAEAVTCQTQGVATTSYYQSMGGNPPADPCANWNDPENPCDLTMEGSEDPGYVTYYTNASQTTQTTKTFTGTRYHFNKIIPASCISITHYGIISIDNAEPCSPNDN